MKTYTSPIQPSNPMSNSPFGHRTLGSRSINSYFVHITKSLQITPYYNEKVFFFLFYMIFFLLSNLFFLFSGLVLKFGGVCATQQLS